VKPVGQGVSELRLTIGPGYRIYYVQDGDQDGDMVIVLLIGGDKSSQQKDIEKAQGLADEWRKDQATKEDGDERD
jgi:putative addiction module killer protein